MAIKGRWDSSQRLARLWRLKVGRIQARGLFAFGESGRRDSNPRPSPWQGDVLPTELPPQFII